MDNETRCQFCGYTREEHGSYPLDNHGYVEKLSRAQIVGMLAEEREIEIIDRWLLRGDGCAVYRNQDLGHPDLGHRKFASFGSSRAQIEGWPPTRLPDIGAEINWRYTLEGVLR